MPGALSSFNRSASIAQGIVRGHRYRLDMNLAQTLLDAIPSALATLWGFAVTAFVANPWPFLLIAGLSLLGIMFPARRRRRA